MLKTWEFTWEGTQLLQPVRTPGIQKGAMRTGSSQWTEKIKEPRLLGSHVLTQNQLDSDIQMEEEMVHSTQQAPTPSVTSLPVMYGCASTPLVSPVSSNRIKKLL